MRPRVRPFPTMLAASAVALLGCYDRTTVISSGPPPDAKLWELTEPETAQLCKTVELRAQSRADEKTVTHASCLLMAGLATQFAQTNDPDYDRRSACQSVYKACLANGAQASDENAQCSTRRFAGCSATVDTYRECQERALDALGDLASRTCDDLIAAPDAGPPPNPFDNPACDTLYGLCSKLTQAPHAPECSTSISTTGAIRADLVMPSDNCYSQVSRTGSVDWISLSVWSSAHLALHGVELKLPVHVAPWSERLDEIGLSVWNDDSSMKWLTTDGCEGDVEVESCKDDGASGDRYRVRNGRCSFPLPVDGDDDASELTVSELSFWSYCIHH